MLESGRKFYDFAEFRIDIRKRRLLRGNVVVPLTPKAFDTLLALIENRKHVVEKGELIEKVWPDVAVEENNLTQNISALRKALREKRDSPQYILTVPGVGYRFIGEINDPSVPDSQTDTAAGVPMESVRGRTANRPRRAALILTAIVIVVTFGGLVTYRLVRRASAYSVNPNNSPIGSIAVLPFRPLVAGDSDEYLGMGMADALITKLSVLRQISVRPTASIARYANGDQDPVKVGSALAVNSILEGRVQRTGDRVRVTVQLLRVSDGSPLWADKFDEKYTDIFTLEDQLSERVAAALVPTLTGQQKQQLSHHYTENTDAYDDYVKGRYYWNKRTGEAVSKSVEYFEDAILKDPNYALAYAGLADAYATLRLFDHSPADVMPKARSAALRALELDNNLAEAHAALAYVKHRYEWDWTGAEQEFKRALALDPDYPTVHQWYGWYLISLGSYEPARAEFERARQLDPLSLYVNLTTGIPDYYSRRYDDAAKEFKRVIEMDPKFPLAHRWLAKTLQQQGNYDQALNEFQQFAILTGVRLDQIPAVGSIYALTGNTSAAHALVTKLTKREQEESPYHLAAVFACMKENDAAFARLQTAYTQRDADVLLLKIEPEVDSLRADQRYADLLRKIGTP